MAQSTNSVLSKRKAITQAELREESNPAMNVLNLLRNLPMRENNRPSTSEAILKCIGGVLGVVPADINYLNECLGEHYPDVRTFYFYALSGLTILAKPVSKANQDYIKRRFSAFLVSDCKPKDWILDDIMYANLTEWQRYTDDNRQLKQDLIRLVLDCDTTNTTFQNILAQVKMVYSYCGMIVLKRMEEYSSWLPNDAFLLPHVENDIERFKVALAVAKEKTVENFQYSYVLKSEEMLNLRHVDFPDLYLATVLTGKLRVFNKNFAINRKVMPKSGMRVIQLAVGRRQPPVQVPILTQEMWNYLFSIGIDLEKEGMVVGKPII